MSKASEYAKAAAAARAQHPQPFWFTDDTGLPDGTEAFMIVNDDGELVITPKFFRCIQPKEVWRLIEWLTDTFGKEPLADKEKP